MEPSRIVSPNVLKLLYSALSQSPMLKEEELEGKHLVITCSINTDTKSSLHSHALIDCGATGYAFVDENFARYHNLPLYPLKTERVIEVIDGTPIESGTVKYLTKVKMHIGQHEEYIPMFVTQLGHYPIVLGIPWLGRHNVNISFARHTITFDSSFCLHHCTAHAFTVQGISIDTPEEQPPYDTLNSTPTTNTSPPLSIAMISASLYWRQVKRAGKSPDFARKRQFFRLSLYEINMALALLPEKKPEEELEEIKTMVPEEYHDFIPSFLKAVADLLPPHRPNVDHKITLKEGFTPLFGPLYSLSREELETLREWILANLGKGFICTSSSPAGAPVLFVRNKNGSLRLCMDYRGLNVGTINNRYPLPLVRETLAQLAKAKYFTTLDIRSAYNLIRIAKGDEWKTAFRTRYGLFESLVMNFGLTNAPADFQKYINDTLRPFLDVFCTAYLDDVLIFSETLEEHKIHVRKVMEALAT